MSGEARKWPNSLDVVLKVAERCNLACPYCYYFFQENDLSKSSPALISEAVIRDVAAFLRRGAQELHIEHLYIGLHGGEPLLLPKKRYDAICRILREELAGVTTVHFGMQTNGTRIDPEWISLFAEHQVGVGVSLDGPPHVHNASRPDHKGKGSYDATVRGLRLLQEAASSGRILPTGVLCVANPNYSGAEIVRHFVEDLGITHFNILLPREGHDSEVWKPQSKWISYFTEIIRYWQTARKTTGHSVGIQFLSEIMAAMMSEGQAQRLDARRSNRHNVITISSDGKLGMDDNIMALDKSLFDASINVRNITLAQFMSTPTWQQLIHAVDKAPAKCANCDWFRTCRSGDLWNRYQKGSGFDQPSVFCETLDTLHTALAAIIAQQEGGLERLTRVLSRPPELWARDFLQPVKPGAASPGLPLAAAETPRLAVVE